MYTVGSIATNTSEDYLDELSTGIVYKYKDYVFSGFDVTKLNKDGDDVMKEALDGAYQTLQFTITSAVISTTTAYAMSKIVTVSGAIFTYVKSGRFINKIRKSVSEIPIVGRAGATALGLATKLGIGNQNERLSMAKMANNNANSLVNTVAIERQTQTKMLDSKRKQMLTTMNMGTSDKNSRDSKKLEAYYHKMKTGSWTNTTIDKNLFLSVVPKEYVTQPFSFNSKFVSQLNSFVEFAKSSEGHLISLAQTHLDYITTAGSSRLS
jgi:hypothetical protein